MTQDIVANILGIPPRDHGADQRQLLDNLKSRLNLQELSLPVKPAPTQKVKDESSAKPAISHNELDRLLKNPHIGPIILRNMKFTG